MYDLWKVWESTLVGHNEKLCELSDESQNSLNTKNGRLSR